MKYFTFVLAMFIFCPLAVSQTTRPTTDPIDSQYPFPNQKPTQQDIEAVLQRLHANMDRKTPTNIINKTSKEEITDFKEPIADAQARLGGYPYGVVHAGMLLASEATGDKRYADYTARRFAVVAERLPYFKAQAEKFGMQGNSFRNFMDPQNLDACGAWGSAMVKARRANVGPDLKEVIDRYAEYISNKQFRLADGTLARKTPQPQSVWGDDMYMSIPFLAQMGKLSGEKKYTDDAAKQVLLIAQKLWVPQKGLFAHGWSAGNPDFNPEIHWARVNGWCIMAMVELLEVMPEDHPQREAILKLYRSHAKGLLPLQSGMGLWHQLLDHEDSYLETSCSAMFAFAMARGVNRGWLNAASYGPPAMSGWNAVATKVNAEGGVDGVCVGTNYASEMTYYYHRPATDDVHGYGPVLLAGAEVIRMLNNDKIDIKYQRGGLYVFTEKAPATKP